MIPISSSKESALREDVREFCQTTFRHRDIYQVLAGKIVFVSQAANYLETQNWEALKDTPLFVTEGNWRLMDKDNRRMAMLDREVKPAFAWIEALQTLDKILTRP